MKKKYLRYAGIISAIVLVTMFAGILLTGSFSFFSPATIDPIPDHATGDLVVITGTTTHMAGTFMRLDILAVSPDPGTNSGVGSTDAFIVRGGGMSNTWSGTLDTSSIPRGEYQVNAYWINETIRSDLLATSRFRLTGTVPAPTGSPGTGENQPPYIRMNHPGTLWRGEQLQVTGTTNLPVDTRLIYMIIKQSNLSVFTVDPKTGTKEVREGLTQTGTMSVLPTTDGVNRWSFAEDSTAFIPSDYFIIVTLESISPEKIGIKSPFDTAPLYVKEVTVDTAPSPVRDVTPCKTITILEFPDHWINQNFRITGTTRFPPGTELLVQVIPTEYDLTMNPDVKVYASSMSGAEGMVTVEEGWGNNVNFWSLTLDKSHMDPNQRNYLVNVSNSRTDNRTYETIAGDTYCSKRLVLPA
jgi:hypothetical protein